MVRPTQSLPRHPDRAMDLPMSTVIEQTTASLTGLAPLRNGDQLDQRAFHERYAAMPEDFRAELIGGTVFVPSPVSKLHARYHALIMTWSGTYSIYTPGTELLDNGTVILDDENEPQPDAVLRIADEYGGDSFTTEAGYVAGAPELHIEVAYGSESIDLNRKLQEYERTGVGEYLVLVVRDKTVRSFVLEEDAYAEQSLPADRIWRSQRFPGLWLDVAALFEDRGPDLLQTLQRGLDSAEHRDFVQSLEERGPQKADT
jgi:Uma2 family endonuclease